jgi:hypothetical protein
VAAGTAKQIQSDCCGRKGDQIEGKTAQERDDGKVGVDYAEE